MFLMMANCYRANCCLSWLNHPWDDRSRLQSSGGSGFMWMMKMFIKCESFADRQELGGGT